MSKPHAITLRSFRKAALAATLPLTLLCAGRAEAISTISQSISNTTLNAFGNLSYARTPNPRTTSQSLLQIFDKFDTNLGTLVGVRFEGNGDLSGSFRGARSSTGTPLSALSGGTATLGLSFLSAGWTTTSTASSFIGSSALARVATFANVGANGTLLTSTGPTINLSGSDSSTYLSFFEGGPGETIEGTFTWSLALTSTNLGTSTCSTTTVAGRCTGFNFSPTGLPTGATALRGDINDFTLYYDYIPNNSSVPAPLPLLGSGVAFAYTRRLRRRIQKARTTH